MIEKPKRPKKIPNQDNKQPQTIQELIRRYDLDNTKIYDFLDSLVEQINSNEKQNEKQIDEIETKVVGTVLYDSSSGTTGNVPLSETADNLIEIFYVDTHSDKQNSKRIDLKLTRDFAIDGMAYASETSINYITNYTISDTSITVSSHAAFSRSYQTGVIAGTIDKNYVKILKVVGYR